VINATEAQRHREGIATETRRHRGTAVLLLCGATVAVQILDGHPAAGFRKRAKPKLRVKPVRVSCGEQEDPKVLEIGMRNDRSHQCFRDSLTSKFWQNEDVHQVREDRPIRNDSSERDLPPAKIRAETKRILDRAFDDAAAATLRPIGGLQKIVDNVHIEARRIRRDFYRVFHVRADRVSVPLCLCGRKPLCLSVSVAYRRNASSALLNSAGFSICGR